MQYKQKTFTFVATGPSTTLTFESTTTSTVPGFAGPVIDDVVITAAPNVSKTHVWHTWTDGPVTSAPSVPNGDGTPPTVTRSRSSTSTRTTSWRPVLRRQQRQQGRRLLVRLARRLTHRITAARPASAGRAYSFSADGRRARTAVSSGSSSDGHAPTPTVRGRVPNADSGRAVLAEGCFLGQPGWSFVGKRARAFGRAGRRIAGTICAATALLPGRCWFVPVTPWAT